MRTLLETGDRWPKQGAKQARHKAVRRRWTGFVCVVKSLQWQRLQDLQDTGRDGVMASPPPLELPFSTC
jgi:hypothetical protein